MPYNAPKNRDKVIHGVNVQQTELQGGKWYTTVDSRVKIAEQADPAMIRREGAGYHVVSVQFVQLGDRWAYHCLVEYPVGSGVLTPGTDFIDLKDSAGVAKAETSAIGRALGLHGIAIEESIASAEEMESAQGAQPAQSEGTQQPQQAQRAPKAAPQNAVSAGVKSMEEAIAGPDSQRELVTAIRNADLGTPYDVQKWFLDNFELKIDPNALKRGDAVLKMGVLKDAIEKLEQHAKQHDRDAAAVPAGSL